MWFVKTRTMAAVKIDGISAPDDEIATWPLEISVHDDEFRKGIRNDVLNEIFGNL